MPCCDSRDKVLLILPWVVTAVDASLSCGLGQYSGDQISFKEAMNSQEKNMWMGAIAEKIESLPENQIW